MVALVVSLVWRRCGAIAEVRRVLVQEGLLWVSPLQVSEQGIAKRLDTLPASALAAVFTDVSVRLYASPPPQLPGLEKWAGVRAQFPCIAMVDGTTLEALRKKTEALQAQPGLVLAGRVMVMVEAFTQRPHRSKHPVWWCPCRFTQCRIPTINRWGCRERPKASGGKAEQYEATESKPLTK